MIKKEIVDMYIFIFTHLPPLVPGREVIRLHKLNFVELLEVHLGQHWNKQEMLVLVSLLSFSAASSSRD